jgi:hypothetical protein
MKLGYERGDSRFSLFWSMLTIWVTVFALMGCVSKTALEQSNRVKQELTSDLKVTRLPITVNLVVDERTKRYHITDQRPSSFTGSAHSISLDVGQQLLMGIQKAADMVFKSVSKDSSSHIYPTLKVRLVDFSFDYRFTLFSPNSFEYTMHMNVESELTNKNGEIIYRRALAPDLKGLGEIGFFYEKIRESAAEGLATLVGLWMRDFAKDISDDQTVQRFAQSLAGLEQAATLDVPEIIINSPGDGIYTDNVEILLTASVRTDSPIKERRISVNGRTLPATRSIIVTEVGDTLRLEERVPLIIGENVITVTAINEEGGTSQKNIRVTRKEPSLITGTDRNLAGRVGERWAVVVGVSKYKHSAKGIPNLNYASTDARAFAEFLKSPQGGNFKEENVLSLIDKEARSAALRSALFTFLKKAIEEDLVIFFFSGQGAPEPGSSDNYYLLTYDADPDDLPSTAIPTWDVDAAFKRTIKARRAVLFIDACHVSSIGQSYGMRGIEGGNLVNRYLKKLSEAGEGKAIFTATLEGQVAIDHQLKGRQTGLFTHYLLEALSGAADENSDRVVTLGEAIDYTTALVSAASRGKQRPEICGQFDRGLPLAIVK